jgi:hypothetical protein
MRQDCRQRPVHGHNYYPAHLSNLLLESHKRISNHSITLLQNTFKSAIRKEWKFQPQYDVFSSRTEDIIQGKWPATDVVILDDEFSPTSVYDILVKDIHSRAVQ